MNFGFMLPSRGPLARPEHPSVITKRGEELSYGFLMFPDHILMPRNISSQYPYPESDRALAVKTGLRWETTITLVTSLMVVV